MPQGGQRREMQGNVSCAVTFLFIQGAYASESAEDPRSELISLVLKVLSVTLMLNICLLYNPASK